MDLKGILGDLLTLEVNTIIKDGMTAHKMPALPFALHDIIHGYAELLGEFGVNLEPYFAEHDDTLWLRLAKLADAHDPKAPVVGKPASAYEVIDAAERAYAKVNGRAAETSEQRRDLFNYVTDLWPVLEQGEPSSPTKRFSMAKVCNGWGSFERLRIAANEALDHRKLARADAVLLERIVGSCSRMKFIVQGLQRGGPIGERWTAWIPKTRNELLMSELHSRGVPLDTLRPEHQAAIRKIWEVGTERIVAQTCIQIDGDVFTRISPALLEQHTEAVRAMILAGHRESIDTSLRYWKLLVDVAEKLVSGLFRGRRS
jgi:hypothetical protein